ncbi:MAG: argininosuccinate lyase [Sphaerochaetaceae bacterium]|nr:argininosuccinate lyase [Sphaerochaetaceae bacterium]MDC7247231.1 argininosuccinate lyase [Sphaerochaetaceae bacterium]
MGKLWQKEITLDSLMEEFTVGNDPVNDLDLIKSDILGSIAHARAIFKAGVLSQQEIDDIEGGLSRILREFASGEFTIHREDEDCHTAIEGRLTQLIGDAGKKIHTGRSRNDQVQTALRLWMRESVLHLTAALGELASELSAFAKKHEFIPMAGRTHMQLAMPSSVGLWASSFAEGFSDQITHLLSLYPIIDQSPLGSAASYGTSLPIDRSYSASLLHFSKAQHNVLYANNSRGLFEAMLLDSCDYIGLTLSKLAQDLILFSLPEFGYFTLDSRLCTGSSIMPQKRNPDGLELTRSRSAIISGYAQQIKSVIRSLPSGYNRDFQDTKEPFMKGMKTTLLLVRIMTHMVKGVEVHEQKLIEGCKKELYATDEVLKRIKEGRPFREVYKEVGMDLESVSSYDPYETVRTRVSEGTSGNLQLDALHAHILGRTDQINSALDDLYDSYRMLCGENISLTL